MAPTKEKSLFIEIVLVVNRFGTNIHGCFVQPLYAFVNSTRQISHDSHPVFVNKEDAKSPDKLPGLSFRPRGPQSFCLLLDRQTLHTDAALVAEHHVVRACAQARQVKHRVALQGEVLF